MIKYKPHKKVSTEFGVLHFDEHGHNNDLTPEQEDKLSHIEDFEITKKETKKSNTKSTTKSNTKTSTKTNTKSSTTKTAKKAEPKEETKKETKTETSESK